MDKNTIRATGGFVAGPLGTLVGKQGAKAIEHGCVDRLTQ